MALAKSIAENPRKFSAQRSVLIVSDSPIKANNLAPFLQNKGYNTVCSVFVGQQLQGIPRQAPDSILLHFTHTTVKIRAIIKALRQRYLGKSVPIIGIFPEESGIDSSLFDSVLYEPVHPTQIAHRVSAMIRLTIMQTEISLRMETLRDDFGIDYRLNPKNYADRLRVLFIGKATPEFMVIINALELKNVEVVAAFTSFTAFDFLHETTFDSVVINALNGMEPGLTISQTMRRNSSLYHTPSLLLANRKQTDSDVAYEHGVSDILYSDSDEKDIQDRILELARFHRLHRQVKTEFDNIGQAECLDESGTYSARFFAKHLNRLISHYSSQDLPVSILTINVKYSGAQPTDPEINNLIMNQTGSMIKNMVRVYDISARIDKSVYAIAFPGQPSSALDPVIKRLTSMTHSVKFGPDHSGDRNYSVELDIESTELGRGITGESWLAQTAPL